MIKSDNRRCFGKLPGWGLGPCCIRAAVMLWGFVSILQGSDAADHPLNSNLPTVPGILVDADDASMDQYFRDMTLTRAVTAIEMGLGGVAQITLENLLQESDGLPVAPEWKDKVRIQLLTVLLQRGFLEKADQVYESLSNPGLPECQLRKVMLDYVRGDRDAVMERLALLDGSLLSQYDRSWLHYVRGAMALREGRVAESRLIFDEAIGSAVNELHESQMQVMVWRQEILNGEASESLVLNLRGQISSALNPIVASQLIQQHAVALVALGRSQEAIDSIERHLSVIGIDFREQRDRLLMMLALIAGPQSGKTALALEDLLMNGRNERMRMMAFGHWMTLWSSENEERAIAFLRNLQSARTEDPVKDAILYVFASHAIRTGRLNEARDIANRMLENQSDRVIRESAWRILSSVSLKRNPPQYRLAAERLIRLMDELVDDQEKARISRMVGDCYLANQDYGNALPRFLQLLESERNPDARDYLFGRAVECHLQMGAASAAVELLDQVRSEARPLSDPIWRAEWNLSMFWVRNRASIDALNRMEGVYKTFENALGSGGVEDWKMVGLLRSGWILAFLNLQKGDNESVLQYVESVLGRLPVSEDPEMEARHAPMLAELRVLEARARFGLGQHQEGQQVFEMVRAMKGLSPEIAASTYLMEARNFRSTGRIFEAQRALVELADRYPSSNYAPVALYEAALHEESRGSETGDREAVRLLERIVRDFPDHPLCFISKLRQGDLLRKVNEFASAVYLYETMIQEWAQDPRLPMVEMALGEAYFALGTSRDNYTDEAVRVFERLLDLSSLSLDVRTEAGTKAASALKRAGRNARAQDILWRVIHESIRLAESDPDAIGPTGRYWLARAILTLADNLRSQGDESQVRTLFEIMEAMELPGKDLIYSPSGT